MDSFDWKKSLGGLGIILVLGTIGLFAKSQARTGSNSDDKAKSTYGASKNKETGSREEGFDYSAPYKTIKVDISGQISEPGVYEITEGSRLEDLVKLAGGLKSNADRDAVNLSVKLQDEQKIVILGRTETISLDDVKALNGSITPMATREEPKTSRRTRTSKGSSTNKSKKEKADTFTAEDAREARAAIERWEDSVNRRDHSAASEKSPKTFSDPYAYIRQINRPKPQQPTGLININRASSQELESLPGVGPSMANRIIESRRQRAFDSIEDLRRVKGIGPTVFRRLSPWLTF